MTAGIIIQKPEIIVAGFRDRVEAQQGIGAVWKRLFAHAQENDLNLDEVQQIGMVLKVEKDNAFDYMAGFIVPSTEVARIVGLDAMVIDSSEFAVVDVEGAVPECIMAGADHRIKEYIPAQGYKPTGPIMEAYAPEGNPKDRTYQMQVWIPVTKEA